MSSGGRSTLLRVLGGRLLLASTGRLSSAAGALPSCSGRAAAAAAATAAAHASSFAGRAASGGRFLASLATTARELNTRPDALRVSGPRLSRHLASAPDLAVASGAAAATATDHAPTAAPPPPPQAPATPPPSSSDRPHPIDYTTLCALAAALRGVALPAKVDEVVQVDAHTVCLRVRVAPGAATADEAGGGGGGGGGGGTGGDAAGDDLDTLWIWLCWHTVGARVTVGPPPPRGGPAEAYSFGRALHSALGGGVLVNARCPVPYERCVELLFAESASAAPDTALVLHAGGAPDNFLALVDVAVTTGTPGAAAAAAKRKKAAAAAAAAKKAARVSAKAIKLPPEPPRLNYGRVLAVSAARPGLQKKRPPGGGSGSGSTQVPVAGAKFHRPRSSVRQLVPSPSETLALWRSNVLAADADAMAFRAAAEAAAAAEAEASEEEEEKGDDDDDDDEAPPAPPPLPARPPKLPDSAIAACIARTYAGVGRATADELCAAAGIDPTTPPAAVDDDAAWAALHAAWSRWLVSLGASHYKLGAGLHGRPFSVLASGDLLKGGPLADRDPLAVAAAAGARAAGGGDPTAALPALERGAAMEVMAAVDAYFRQVKDAAAPTTLEAHVRTGAARALRRARDKAASLATQADRAASADAKSHTADLLMAHVHAVRAGATEVTVTDWVSGSEVTIPLGDGRTPPPDVAAALYKEARRLRRGAEAVGPLLEAARADVAELEAAVARLEALPALGEGEEAEAAAASADPVAAAARADVLQEVRTALEARNWLKPWREAGLEARGAALAKRAAKRTGAPSSSSSSSSPFRRFTAPSGAEVLVGRNNRDNDRLSLRVANPDDTWLHARGVPGAHVVLRSPADGGGDAPPDDDDLRFAAAIAAFFSKARDGGTVDVSHTPARNVKKPRGAPPGLVTLRVESVVRVRPDDVAAEVEAAAGDSSGDEG